MLILAAPAPGQGLPGVSRTAASYCIISAPYHQASSNSSFCSRDTLQEQGACQPVGASMTLVLGAQRAALPLGLQPQHRQKPPVVTVKVKEHPLRLV